MKRRTFLRNLGAGTAVVGASLAEADEDAKKVYRVGIIGSTGRGNYGHGLDVVWKKIPRIVVAAVADDDEGGLASAVTRTGARKGYSDYRVMLAEEKLDIVAVCPRWIDQHHEMLLACAAHDCHVYVEKPFCRTLEEADEVVAAFEKKRLKLAIAHVNRYRPELLIARRLIKDGKLGTILEVRARGKEDRRGGGEDLWVLGTHLMDLMRAFFGEVESCSATVRKGGALVTREHVREGNEGIGLLAGDEIEATYRFRDGVTGYFSSHRNQGGRPSRFGIRIYGSQGVLEFLSGGAVRLSEDPSWTGRGEGEWKPVASYATDSERRATPVGNEAAVIDLIESIETGRAPVSSIHDARAATEMIVAVFESHRLGRRGSFPLKNRGNPLAIMTE